MTPDERMRLLALLADTCPCDEHSREDDAVLDEAEVDDLVADAAELLADRWAYRSSSPGTTAMLHEVAEEAREKANRTEVANRLIHEVHTW